MKNNYLEILLCENLLNTYSSLIIKKEMYFQVIKNIQNTLIFPKYKFQLNQINDTKLLIEYFKQTNKCFLNEGNYYNKNLFLFQKDFSFEFILLKSYSKENVPFYIFPEKKLIFQLNPYLKQLYILNLYEKKIRIKLEEIPQNILYLKDNIFIFHYSKRFELYSFIKSRKEFKKINTFVLKYPKIYSKIIEIKNEHFICYSPQKVDILIKECQNLLIPEKTINDVVFIKRINENLIFFHIVLFFFL